jgi:hypothetical protein
MGVGGNKRVIRLPMYPFETLQPRKPFLLASFLGSSARSDHGGSLTRKVCVFPSLVRDNFAENSKFDKFASCKFAK